MSSLTIKKYEREIFLDLKNKIPKQLTSEQLNLLKIIKEKAFKLEIKNSENIKNNDTGNKNYNSKSGSNSSWRKVKPSIKPKNLSVEETNKNLITGLLNKLAPNNFENISKKILDILITNNNLINSCVNDIFLKAVYQPIYCPHYVKLLLLFSDNNYDIDSLILDMCEKFTNIINSSNKNINDKETYEEFCASNKIKQFKIGYSQFMGELYKKQLIVFEIIEIFIDELIQNLHNCYQQNKNDLNIENNIVALCKLVNTCYEKNKDILKDKNKYNKIYELDISKKLKFKLLDILELK